MEKKYLEFYINDPSTPDLKHQVSEFSNPILLKLDVDNKTNKIDDDQNQISNSVFVILTNSINSLQEITDCVFKKWASTAVLKVHPKHMKEYNAYYDRNSLSFGYDTNKDTQEVVYTSKSLDIITHELGHAVLDSLCPKFFHSHAVEIWAFHEAFADIVTFFSISEYENALKYSLEETNGNMFKSNVASRLGEELATCFVAQYGKGAFNPLYLRDLSIRFDYVNPIKLPKSSHYTKLASNPHSFGRVFSSAFYECVVRVYDSIKEKEIDVKSFQKAKNEVFVDLIESIKIAPASTKYFYNVSKCMSNIGKHKKIYNDVFVSRGILPITSLSKPNQEIGNLKKIKNTNLYFSEETKNVNIISALSNESSKTFSIKLPSTSLYEIDGKNIVSFIDSYSNENDEQAAMFIHFATEYANEWKLNKSPLRYKIY